MNQKKGFTLVELVSVIVIISLIALVITSAINKTIQNNKEDLYQSQLENILTSAQLWSSNNPDKLPEEEGEIYRLTVRDLIEAGLIEQNAKNVKNSELVNENIEVLVEKTNKKYVYKINEDPTKDFDYVKGVNKPLLVEGMTPVKWDNNYNEITTTSDDPDWYDYENKKWANAKTKDGSYFVWIPRYAYKIETCFHQNAAECLATTGKNSGNISIKFLIGTSNSTVDKTKIEYKNYEVGIKDTSMHYFKHPAFTFGYEEITGFWVAKFEASNTLEDIEIKPNVESLWGTNSSYMFTSSLNMKNNIKYGWENDKERIDTHLIKNIEWGAVTYLSQTKYGKNDLVWKVDRWPYPGLTGHVSNGPTDLVSVNLGNVFNSSNGEKGSTSGTVYGVYDMAGRQEAVAAYTDISLGRGYLDESPMLDAPKKYVDIYKEKYENASDLENFEFNKNRYGDGIYEITDVLDNGTKSGWQESRVMFSRPGRGLFYKGGNQNDDSGVIFTHDSVVINGVSFRPTLIIKTNN